MTSLDVDRGSIVDRKEGKLKSMRVKQEEKE